MFGYPDYELSSNERDKLVDKKETTESLYYNLTVRGENLSNLQGTKAEVDKIAKLMQNRQWDAEIRIGAADLEENVKSCLKPRVLHIATHGYFQADTLRHTNPFRSGLMLAGAARTLGGEKDDKTKDGILTAYEAMNFNLDNMDLVVLSACETGLGEIGNEEGVYGLQRAFKVAGAKTIIMSLWKVHDEAT